MIRYEGEYTDVVPTSKSTGQFGSSADKTTTNPANTAEARKEHQERGEKTAENMRYGQTISEGGMSGFTTGQSGEATQGGYGRQKDQGEEVGEKEERRAAGYGGKEDHNREIGA